MGDEVSAQGQSLAAVDRALVIAVFGLLAALALKAFSADETAGPAVAPPAGFVEIALPANSHALVAVPFQPADPSLEAVLGGQLTASTNLASADRVLFWDAAANRYRAAAKVISGTDGKPVWFETGTADSGDETLLGPAEGDRFRIEPGTGFILCNRQSFAQTVRLAGLVIMDDTRSVRVPAGFGTIAYPFSSARNAGETKWNQTNALHMGAGYWVRSEQGELWQPARPYANPFSTSNAPARIADLLLDPDKVTLDIQLSDASVPAVDILALDLAPSTVITDWTRGWRLAAANVAVGKGREAHWCDDPTGPAAARKGVRLYLVIRSDSADLDGDGTPDLRQRFLQPAGGNGADAGRAAAAAAAVPDLPETAGLSAAEARVPSEVPAQRVARGIVFVDIVHGDDRFDGLAPVPVKDDGPKRTIRAGLKSAVPGGTVVVREGVYNENISVAGKPVRIRVSGKVRLVGDAGK